MTVFLIECGGKSDHTQFAKCTNWLKNTIKRAAKHKERPEANKEKCSALFQLVCLCMATMSSEIEIECVLVLKKTEDTKKLEHTQSLSR